MYNPDYQVNVTPVDAVCTIGAMEQLGKNFEAFLEFLLKKKPLICINIETMNEIYTNETLCDYVTIEYTKKRKYLFGYLSKLRKIEKQGVIKYCKSSGFLVGNIMKAILLLSGNRYDKMCFKIYCWYNNI